MRRVRVVSARIVSAAFFLAVVLPLLAAPDAALAVCAPASPVNNADVTCTGTTTNQNFPSGYGTNTDTGNTIAVVPGATVTGTSEGIIFGTGTVLNSGSIAGGVFGINASTANVSNAGSIAASAIGIVANIANVSNAGSITGGTEGILAGTAANVSNSGSIAGGTGVGIETSFANVRNSGSIAGGTYAISAIADATVSNSGSITADQYGIVAGTATVTNSGTITVGKTGTGIVAPRATVSNSGTISGGAFGIYAPTTATVINSGTISGSSAALRSFGNPDTLTLLPGSKIIGAITLGGGGDTVNFRTGNQNLTFDTLTGATVTSTVPFAVSGNRVATIDPASFGSSAAVLTDFTRAVFGIVGDLPDVQPTTGGLAAGFAPEKAAEKAPQSNVASRAQEALAGLDAYASDRLIFKNPSMVTGDGRAVWARGFGGQRIQQADAQAQTFRTATTFFGGAMGADLLVRPDLRLGALAGGGSTRSSQAANSGDGESDIGFGGLYGRTRFGASFIDAMVLFGGSRNRTTRTINNNLAPGGVETARADFNGWFVAPELALGRRIAFGSGWAVIPALRLRYLAAGFGGSTETGTSAPLTVNARTLQSIEERGELKLTKAESIRSGTVLLSAHAGVLGLQRIGDSDVNATLLGQSLAFATPGKSSITGVYTGLGADWPISGRLSAFGGIEYTVMTDLSETVSGRGGVRMTW